MPDPHFHGSNRIVPASSILDVIGETIRDIRFEDGLTWAEMGAVMHKSEDRAQVYSTGGTEMGVIAYLRCKERWGERFSGPINAMLFGSRALPSDAAELARGSLALTQLIAELQSMLLDGDVSDAEVIAAAPLISAATETMARLNTRLAHALARRAEQRDG